MFCFGTQMRYRFDLLLKSCPSITKDYIIIFTTKYYYDLYKDYHNDFEFVAIDDLRKDNAVSLQNELCIEAPNDDEYFKKYSDFYQFNVTAVPFYLQRYILKYFAEHNILNFMICDTDMVIKNNVDAIKDLFNNIAKGTVYAWNQGRFEKTSEMAGYVSNFLQTNIQPLFPQLKFDMALQQFRNDDGFIYGGHFHNREDLMLLFNLADTMITESFVNNYKHLYGSPPCHNFIWVYPAAYDLLSNNLNYEYKDAQNIIHLPKYGNIMVHKSRPEDTFHFYGQRPQWSHFLFDHSDITSIPKFIQNNKQQLKNYYAQHLPVLEITDTHVYTYLPG
jgi:hypothetical protein